MNRIVHITSLDSAELAPYKTLRRPSEHLREGIFVAEGEKVVRRLLLTDLKIRSLLLTPRWYERLAGGESLKKTEELVIYIAGDELLNSIVGFNLHQGIMGIADIPDAASLEELAGVQGSPRLFVALDGLVSAENVGTIVRNCAAFGAHGLIVGETSSSPYLRRAVRNSMGTVFGLPIVGAGNLADALQYLITKFSFTIVGAHPQEGKRIFEADFSRSMVLVMGNEGDGISANILAACTERVAIPMLNGTDSLNVASASAVFLYEIQRQRARGPAYQQAPSVTPSR